MTSSEFDLSQPSINKCAIDFSNKYNVNATSLTIYPPKNDCFIKISPNNNYIAFVQNNRLEIFTKKNGQWDSKLQYRLNFDKKKIRGINWSLDNKMILVYGNNEKEKSKEALIKAINLNDTNWNCEIKFKGTLNHASFYPDSLNIVYIKELINILNIVSLLKYNNSNSKNIKENLEKIKYQFLFIKFNDERAVNYVESKGNIYMILPCYGRKLTDKNNRMQNIEPSDHIIILLNKRVFKCFEATTKDLDRIIPLHNSHSFFIVVEKELYKLPFYIYNIYGEVMYKSEYNKQSIPRMLTNPCLLCNKNKETNFIVTQAPEGKLEIFGCQNILNRSDICYFYDYNKINDYIEKNKKSKSFANIGTKSQNSLYSYNKNVNLNYYDDENYVEINDILFLEEQLINNQDDSSIYNGMSLDDINLKNNKRKRKLIKVNPYNVEPCYEENDYLMHCEVSSDKNYICFINQKYPKYLFFGNYFQSGVFKIIKFMNDVISFKWSTEQDILLVTLDSPFIYLISKDYYLNYNLEENYNLNNIDWSPSGKEVILSDEEKNIRMVAILD